MKYTEDFKAQVVEAYKDPSIPLAEIIETYGISHKTIDVWVAQAGVPQRRPRGKTKNTGKVCPKCRKKITLGDARFCPYCATDVRTPREITVERLRALCNKAMVVPDSIRDEFIQAINAAITELQHREG